MARVYNFSAGPSMLPEWVLRTASQEMLDYQGSGQCVMEMSHRSSEFQSIIDDCEARLRELLQIPDNYRVLFLQGGASLQFAMAPLNFLSKHNRAGVIHTGQWTKKAIAEIKKIGECKIVASSEDRTFSYIPETTREMFEDVDYVHICQNNTIYGTKYPELPDVGTVPLVADLSSCILSEPIDVSRYAMIFAGAQKNMGPAGLTVVIIREDMVGHAKENLPTMLNYQTFVDSGSMFNTPPTYAIYICGLVLRWLKEEIGGLEEMQKLNRQKAQILYDYLDESKRFSATVENPYRSLMNVPFVTGDGDLDAAFIQGAKQRGLINVKGHRSVGGMRASIYNAMPIEGVKALVEYMNEFEKENR